MYATIVPVFLWLSLGLIASVLIFTLPTMRRVMLATWLAAAFLLGDSPQNLIRYLIPVDRSWSSARFNPGEIVEQIPVRVVSLNCMNTETAIAEVSFLKPDVVLIQESVPQKKLQRILETHFLDYQMAWSGDTTVLVKGTATPIPVSKELGNRYQFVLATLPDGTSFHVVSVHLIHSPRSIDFWNLETWKTFADLRSTRRKQLLEIRAEIGETIGSNPAIMGGDFNAPAGDAIYELMKPRFRDSWPQAGRGWGKTSLNNFPIHRIDQVWTTEHFKIVDVTARVSKVSDHRAVVCDVWLPK